VKIYVDECLPHWLAKPLAEIFKKHTFKSSHTENLWGMEDVPLFQELGMRDYDLIITEDARQLLSGDERGGLRDAGLTWVGVPQPETSGYHSISEIMSTVVTGLPFIFADSTEAPQAFRLQPALNVEKRAPSVELL
jgi:hypothetical protein